MEKMTTEQLVAWAEKIPMEELYDILRKVTGISDLKFTSKVLEGNYNRVIIAFESQDLSDKIGFLNLIFKEIKIQQFNSEVSYSDNDDFETTPYYWGTVDFRWTSKSNGHNGLTFMNIWYEDKKGWTYELRCD